MTSTAVGNRRVASMGRDEWAGDTKPCPACKGVGKVDDSGPWPVAHEEDRLVECLACNGTGKQPAQVLKKYGQNSIQYYEAPPVDKLIADYDAARAEIAKLERALVEYHTLLSARDTTIREMGEDAEGLVREVTRHNEIIAFRDARVARLEAVVRDASNYLASNQLNYIGSGSRLHRDMSSALFDAALADEKAGGEGKA